MKPANSVNRTGTTIALLIAVALPLFAGCQSDCGDGVICPETEQCDDGNLVAGDGCDAACQVEGVVCGDGLVEENEACDDGFADACGTCNADCSGPGTGSTCGDGIVCPQTEQCNVASLDPNIACTENCDAAAAVCGNGILESGESCDDGFADACGTCNEDCTGPGADAPGAADALFAQSAADLVTSIANIFLTTFIGQLFGPGGF